MVMGNNISSIIVLVAFSLMSIQLQAFFFQRDDATQRRKRSDEL